MPSSAVASPPSLEQSRPAARFSPSVLRLLSSVLSFAVLWFICCRHLGAEWSYNEQYNYGWFVPFFALYLFWLRWEDAPPPQAAEAPSSKSQIPKNSQLSTLNSQRALIAMVIAISALLLLFPIRLIEVANPDWRIISWIHTLVAVALTLLVIWWIGGRPWLRHFSFPIAFVLVSVPWLSAIEAPLIQGLMPTVASIATETLSLFGIPAEIQGNLIRINSGVVGVNEACSGVRSLQTSIMIGLLFGELKRFSVLQRIVLVVAAVGLAFVANCGRAFFLVWIAATRGVPEVEHWHDIAGYAIVGLVFFGCLGVTAWLARGQSKEQGAGSKELEETEDSGSRARTLRREAVGYCDPSREAGDSVLVKTEGRIADVGDQTSEVGAYNPHSAIRNPQSEVGFGFRISNFEFPRLRFLVIALLWLIAIEIAVEAWYRSHETNLSQTAQWSVRWPKSAPEFRELKIDDRTRSILHYDEGRGASWRNVESRNGDRVSELVGQPASLLYFFRWQPGHNSALLANAHRPDVCLPASGWRQIGDHGVRHYKVSDGLSVPFRHFVFGYEGAGRTQYAHAFYCVWEDRARPSQENAEPNSMKGDPSAWTRTERIDAVLKGRRHLGQQVMEYLLIEPRKGDVAETETAFAERVRELIVPTKL